MYFGIEKFILKKKMFGCAKEKVNGSNTYFIKNPNLSSVWMKQYND